MYFQRSYLHITLKNNYLLIFNSVLTSCCVLYRNNQWLNYPRFVGSALSSPLVSFLKKTFLIFNLYFHCTQVQMPSLVIWQNRFRFINVSVCSNNSMHPVVSIYCSSKYCKTCNWVYWRIILELIKSFPPVI